MAGLVPAIHCLGLRERVPPEFMDGRREGGHDGWE